VQALEDLILEEQQMKQSNLYSRGANWTSGVYRIGLIILCYLTYPVVAELLAYLPVSPNQAGYQYLSLVSFTFGTLVAATVSDASSRAANLRAIAVEETSVMLPLVKRLEALLFRSGREGDEDFLADALDPIWEHSNSLICGSRLDELKGIASGDDCLLDLVLHLQLGMQANHSDLGFAMSAAEKLVDLRGKRLSLENAGSPTLQIGWLRLTTISIIVAYAYVTLDRNLFDGDFSSLSDPVTLATAAFGTRMMFSFLIAAMAFSVNLAWDLNRPFDGFFRLESLTIVATLLQMRMTMARHLDRTIDSGLKKQEPGS
jgi:hypothetical protein